ncbi:MAG TPA: radical SAM protein [Thermoanaerobaculia bacterium]|nr:radical SAM protein [Thermoanaerobaculia bacterium]
MTVEVRPLGVQCNLGCHYCYQNPQRQAGNTGARYDLEAIKAAVESEGGPFALFGGEPLLVPLEDLETLWAWGLDRFGSNSIQTNGVLITSEHVELFRRYRVHVGISVDGPGELNDLRWQGTLERTREGTRRTTSAIELLCANGIVPSIIATLHRRNAAAEHLPRLAAWFRELDNLGITTARLHALESESENVRALYALSERENIEAMLFFARLEAELPRLHFDVFREAEALLMGDDRTVSCVWRACDPYTTSAVRGIEGHGQRSNCGRTNKEGIDFVKSDTPGHERALVLQRTPFEAGGCRGCRFFIFCKGQCPGTAMNGDWRNRSEHCGLWYALFEYIEQTLLARGEVPLSRLEVRFTAEERLVEGWLRGENRSLHEVLA